MSEKRSGEIGIKRGTQVVVLMGSANDWPTIEPGVKELDRLEVSSAVFVASAHRTPERVREVLAQAQRAGTKVIIAAAGLAAHLPGVVAAETDLPVIGLPIAAGPLSGVDALYSIAQMPPGVPVATVGLNNSKNAAVLAARIIALGDAVLRRRLAKTKRDNARKVVAQQKELDRSRETGE